MEEDMPKLTVTLLLILVVVISVLGTWVMLSEISTIQPQYSEGVGSDEGSGKVSFYKGNIPTESVVTSQAKVSLTIEEVQK